MTEYVVYEYEQK